MYFGHLSRSGVKDHEQTLFGRCRTWADLRKNKDWQEQEGEREQADSKVREQAGSKAQAQGNLEQEVEYTLARAAARAAA